MIVNGCTYVDISITRYIQRNSFQMKHSIIYISLILIIISCSSDKESARNRNDQQLIPTPTKVLKRSGTVTLKNNFWIITDVSDSSSARMGKYLVEKIDEISGLVGTIADLYSTRNHEQGIVLEIIEDPSLHPQGYNLNLTSRMIKIDAVSEQGLFYGITTILEILRSSWDSSSRSAEIQQVVIKDQPVFNTRIIDLSEEKNTATIDGLAPRLGQFKINAIKINPELTEKVDHALLRKYHISVLDNTPVTTASTVTISNVHTENQQLFTSLDNTGSDTLLIILSSQVEAEPQDNFLTASQLGWYGPSQKSYNSLETYLDQEIKE